MEWGCAGRWLNYTSTVSSGAVWLKSFLASLVFCIVFDGLPGSELNGDRPRLHGSMKYCGVNFHMITDL